MIKFLITGVLVFTALLGFSQTTCVDELAINPTYQCNYPFSPVCACDGKTYFNECDAIYHGGIQFNSYTSGVCGDAKMFLGQDPLNKLIRLFVQFKPTGGTLTFMIVDMYGGIMQQLFINSSNNLPIERDISTATFPAGVYIAYVYGGGYRETIKFVAGSL